MKTRIILITLLLLNSHSLAFSKTFSKTFFEAKVEMPKIENSWCQIQDNKLATGLNYNESFPELDWWKSFQDNNLNALIEDALTNNPDINIAKTNIEEARGMVKAVFAGELPKVDAGGTYYRAKFSENVNFPGTDGSTGSFFGNGQAFNFFSFPINASYEVDYLRKNHDKTESAKKMYKATEYEEKAVRIALISDVASAYFSLIKIDKLIELQGKRITIAKDILKMENAKYQKGFANFEDVEAIKAEVKQNEIENNELIKEQALICSQLAVLTGYEPTSLSTFERAKWSKELADTNIINSGVSSDLLARRPDIMAAEAELQSSLIDIKVARKEFLPSIVLNIQDLGFMATSFNNVFNSNSFNYLIGGILTQKLFNGGATKANLRIKKATSERRLYQYRKTILTALKEIEDSFAKVNSDYNSLKNQEKNTNSSKEVLAVLNAKYAKGFVDYIAVREIENKYYENQMLLVDSQSNFLMDRISLYKELGGGY